MKKEYIRLNVALKPSREILEKVSGLSNVIARKYASWFVLDRTNFHPHITVYSPEYPLKNVEKVIRKTKKIVSGVKKIKFKVKKVTVEAGWIGIELEYSKEMKKIHESIVEGLNPLRNEYVREKYNTPEYQEDLTKKQKQNIVEYGYPNCMSLYKPHLTIIRLKDEEQAEKLAKELKWDNPVFTADAIAVYKTGDHGTCTELVEEFELK